MACIYYSSLSFSLIFFTFLIIFSIRFSSLWESPVRRNEVSDYKYFRYDKNTKRSTFGVVTIHEEKFEDEEFLSYEDDAEVVLISTPESTEYICQGSCVCYPSDSDRRTSGVIVRSVSYFVATVSSLLALEKANEYFKTKCHSYDSHQVCEEGMSIQSEVDHCEIAMLSEIKEEKGEVKQDSNIDDGKTVTEEKKFSCRGGCIINSRLKDPEMIKDAEEYDCSKKKIFRPIKITSTISEGEDQEEELKKEVEYARQRFIEQVMIKHCRDRPRVVPLKYRMEQYMYKKRPDFCIAGTASENESVFCYHLKD